MATPTITFVAFPMPEACCAMLYASDTGDESSVNARHSFVTITLDLPCNAWEVGSPPARHNGRTKVNKPSAAGLLLCSQVVQGRQEARQGRLINKNTPDQKLMGFLYL